jgi:probable rRNA maturation factor
MSDIDILVEDENWSAIPDLDAVIHRAISAVCAVEAARGAVSVLLADDATIRDLNARFRGKDSPTNVLSFPASSMPGEVEPAQGDIALAFGTCAREAEEAGKPLAAHLSHLVVHAMLHLVGYDHETDQEAEGMEARETAILATLGIADPYAGTEPARGALS